MRITSQQAQEQQIRFDAFMKTVNLPKIGKKIVDLTINESGMYNQFNYTTKILNLVNVKQSFYHPEYLKKNQNHFYGEILRHEALQAYVNSIQKS